MFNHLYVETDSIMENWKDFLFFTFLMQSF